VNNNKFIKPQNKERKEKVKIAGQKPDLTRKRSVKSAQRHKNEKKVARKAKSATAKPASSISLATSGSVCGNQNKNNVVQPEILKYHRENSYHEQTAALPSIDKTNRYDAVGRLDLPPTAGIFSGPCQFCGKPIVTVPPLEEFDQEGLEVTVQ